ncbi:MAG: penicillin-binding protein 2 [Patescibacteria group bacterium]|nr:penicillin-binding protein 2 [Patescibacteria group bacterium]MDD5121459.1 penicillin-binding protein 2 [Patescibacteria group bacterium]MDD5222029.1 penicillin-binding protein 2 [Patescibacteria group bacterium]MDD5396379.1 penicillin-binding protein 2 [Patescibacteria group bacterium]
MKNNRLWALIIIILIAGGIIVIRLFSLQILKYSYYKKQAEATRSVERIIDAERGDIKDISGQPLAVNLKSYSLCAVPANVQNPEDTVGALAPFLDIKSKDSAEYKDLVKTLSYKNDFYKILKKDISEEEARGIKELALPGIFIEDGYKRYYSEKNTFSHVVGFLGVKDDKLSGQYGIEEYLNNELAGEAGLLAGEKTPSGSLILDSEKIIKKPTRGVNVVLTIDRSIQYITCKALAEGVKRAQAAGGSAVIIEPVTGKILALCNYPDFDPNNYNQVKNYSTFFNSAVAEAYEPGSVFKIITMAAALDSGKVAPETTYVDTGFEKIAGYTIKNSDLKAHGVMTMTNVLEKSLNTGAIFAARQTGLGMFRTYVKNFGLASLTGIEQPGEALGDISNLNKSGEIYLATASFGQGISITPVQMAAAVGAIANQGKLMKPYLIDKIVKSDGTTMVNESKFIRQVISPATATTLTAMMVSALENGYGKLARTPGYWTAGKTGTAQVANPNGGYSMETIHSFVGFVPHDNPIMVGVIKIDRPKIGNFAESTAAPIFGQIAPYVLKYYNVQPNKQ